MEIYEAMDKRRTIRTFKGAVSEETLKIIILAGTKAMSAMNGQPWEFIVIDRPDLVDRIAEHKYQQNRTITPRSGLAQEDIEARALDQKNIYRNCSVVAVCHKAGFEAAVSAWACIQNMALAATAEGVGVVPSTFWEEHKSAVEEVLGLPEGYELGTVMLIGEQEGQPGKIMRRPDFSWLHRNSYGAAYY